MPRANPVVSRHHGSACALGAKQTHKPSPLRRGAADVDGGRKIERMIVMMSSASWGWGGLEGGAVPGGDRVAV